jgi:DNA-binding response OmpR family regulator
MRFGALRSGYHILEAANGNEALDVLQRHEGEIHLLLTDVVLPGTLNGKELSDRLRGLRPGLNVLFMSGYSSDLIGHHGVLDKDIAYISKPFTPDALAARVREVLDQGRKAR